MIRSGFFKKFRMADNAGFTLLEAVIALFIFTVGTLAVVGLQTSSINSNTLAKHNTEASTLAASVVENIRPLNYTKDAELTDGNHALPNQGPYAVSYSIQRDAVIDNTMLIQVNVSWLERGAQKNVNLIYIKFDII